MCPAGFHWRGTDRGQRSAGLSPYRDRWKHSRSGQQAEYRALGAYRRARRRAIVGLVHGPYLTARAICSLTTAVGGACTKLRRKYARAMPAKYRPPRGVIRAFSRRSRTRLQQTLCAIPISQVGRGMLFVTLTYPRQYPGDWQAWKRQLDSWSKRLRRKFPRAAAVWKLEPQRRGAPHYHLIVVGVPYLGHAWLARTWYEVVASGDPKHLAAGTQVAAVISHRGVLSYAAKYTAKAQSLPDDWQDGVGRWWGVINRAGLGIEWLVVPLSQRGYYAAVRCLLALVSRRQRARGRAPPRASPAGYWAVIGSTDARRIGKLFGGDAVRVIPA